LAVAVAHTITLADATSGGTWSSSAPSKATVDAGGVVTGVATGSTNISYTVTNGVCHISAIKGITVAASRMILQEERPLQLYPNPSTGALTIDCPGQGTLTVFTLEGKMVKTYQVPAGKTDLTLPFGLAAGTYLCRYAGEEGSLATVRLTYQPQ
jgi:hypothetical protein